MDDSAAVHNGIVTARGAWAETAEAISLSMESSRRHEHDLIYVLYGSQLCAGHVTFVRRLSRNGGGNFPVHGKLSAAWAWPDLCAIWVSTLCRPCHFCIVQISWLLSDFVEGEVRWPESKKPALAYTVSTASMNMIAVLLLHFYSSTKQHSGFCQVRLVLSNVTYVPPTFCTYVSIERYCCIKRYWRCIQLGLPHTAVGYHTPKANRSYKE
jgi:hypothetical protein